MASTVFIKDGQVKVYDSVYTTISKKTTAVISHLYGPTVSLHLVNINKQRRVVRIIACLQLPMPQP